MPFLQADLLIHMREVTTLARAYIHLPLSVCMYICNYVFAHEVGTWPHLSDAWVALLSCTLREVVRDVKALSSLCMYACRGLLDTKTLHQREKRRTKEERDLHNLFK